MNVVDEAIPVAELASNQDNSNRHIKIILSCGCLAFCAIAVCMISLAWYGVQHVAKKREIENAEFVEPLALDANRWEHVRQAFSNAENTVDPSIRTSVQKLIRSFYDAQRAQRPGAVGQYVDPDGFIKQMARSGVYRPGYLESLNRVQEA